jgi:hypothetical protein
MRAATFVKELAKAAPSEDDLRAAGFSQVETEAFIASYKCIPRETNPSDNNGQDEVLILLRHWDTSRVEVGIVTFLNQPYEENGKTYIGYVEQDNLVVLSNGEVVVEELGNSDHILWRVAVNGAHLLEALAVAARFSKDCMVTGDDAIDVSKVQVMAKRCSDAAGGPRYEKFFTMFFNAD